MKPRLLDLFCCAGGAGTGYARAGFDVVGVDIDPQPHYPFEFHQGDALEYLVEHWSEFDAVHASPPCQAHSDLQKQNKRTYADWIPGVRNALRVRWPLPYVIENVEGAPLENPVTLCGAMFPDLRVYRHRLFETNWQLAAPAHPQHTELCFTHDKRKAHYGRPLDLTAMRVQVTGGGNAPVWAKAQAMGVDWMTGRELNEAIPPAFTRFIGEQLMAELTDVAA